MTVLVIAIIALSAACAWFAWRAWADRQRREREADAAARAFAEARAREAAVVEQAHHVEAAAVERITAARDEALSGDRDAVVAEALRRAQERYNSRQHPPQPPFVECSCDSVGECDDQGTVACACKGDCWGCSCDGRRPCDCPDCANACDVVDRAGKRCMRPSVAVAEGDIQVCDRCLMGAIGVDEDGNPRDFDA